MANSIRHTHEELSNALEYDPYSGDLTWKIRPSRRTPRGSKAGYERDVGRGKMYITIGFQGKDYFAHRIAWLFMKGEWPEKDIDHRDGNGMNNSWKNIRLAERSQNMGNMGISSHNTTGFKGVSYHKKSGKFTAQISIKDRKKHLGSFATAEEAHAAYRIAALEYFGPYARFE